MPESQIPGTPQRWVGVNERLGRVQGSPAKTLGIAVLLLVIAIVIIALIR
jgi:hypothetical protein